MKPARYIEELLQKVLPVSMFNCLVRFYQVGKKRLIQSGHYINAGKFRFFNKLNPGKKKILNLDTYGWIGIDILHHITEKFPAKVSVLENSISWEAYEKDTNTDLNVTRENYWNLSHEGLLLWELAKVSIIKHLGKVIIPGKTVLDNEDLECTTRYYQWAVNCHALAGLALDKYQPDYVLLTQGGVYDSRVFAEQSKKRNIPAIAVENSFSSGHFYADTLSGQILNRHAAALTGPFITECLALNPDKSEEDVFRFFHHAISSKEDDHKTDSGMTAGEIRSLLGVPENRKIILFLGQVRTDASVILDSTLYPDPVSIIVDLTRILERHEDYFLIIRLHPKEATMDRIQKHRNHRELCHNSTLNELARRGITGSGNVRIVSDRNVNTYKLMEMSDLGVTINSQSGLEMALLGRPVVTAGRCFYANKGFTWDLPRPELLEAVIDKAIRSKMSEREKQSLTRFCHYLFFDYLIPKDLSANTERLYRLFGLNHDAVF